MQVKAIAEDRMKVMRRMWTSLWFSSTATFGSSSRLMGSDMPDFGFGRCDGHHETVDFRLRKIGARQASAIKKIEMRGYSL